VPYRTFLLATASGGVVWAFGTTFLLYHLGRVAERWLKDLSWGALVVAVLCGVLSTLWLRRRARRLEESVTQAGEAAPVAAPAVAPAVREPTA
jgi:membrane protein DedA with SNARE-associated domain